MKNSGRQFWWTLVAGILCLLAVMRDWFAPGFFSIAGRYHHRSEFDPLLLLAGAIFVITAIQKAVRHKA